MFQWNRSAWSLQRDVGSTLLRTIFELLFQEFSYEPVGLLRRGGRVPKSLFFEKPNETMSFFRNAFQSTLLKHPGEVLFLFCAMQTFSKFKNASELSWEKVLLIRVLQKEQIMRHGWSVALTYCYRLYNISAFSNRHAVMRKLLVWQQKRKFGTVANISLTWKYNLIYLFIADTKSIVWTHTLCRTQVDKNRQYRT